MLPGARFESLKLIETQLTFGILDAAFDEEALGFALGQRQQRGDAGGIAPPPQRFGHDLTLLAQRPDRIGGEVSGQDAACIRAQAEGLPVNGLLHPLGHPPTVLLQPIDARDARRGQRLRRMAQVNDISAFAVRIILDTCRATAMPQGCLVSVATPPQSECPPPVPAGSSANRTRFSSGNAAELGWPLSAAVWPRQD